MAKKTSATTECGWQKQGFKDHLQEILWTTEPHQNLGKGASSLFPSHLVTLHPVVRGVHG